MQGEQVVELNQLEEILRGQDAIMEPNILDVLKRYMKDGGKPATAVEYLSDNYAGYAQMASLVVEWMRELQAEGGRAEQQEDLDEAHFLRELAKQHFDPEKFTGVFTGGGSGPPKWLDGPNGLLADRAGRQLIYELSAQHRNCLLLNYAIQKILKAGHEDEVAGVGSSLASYFGVFHRLLANRLKEVPQAQPGRLESLAAELKETCCQGQHTYVHAQQVLSALGAHPRGARFRRLSQELELHAVRRWGPPVWQMHAWFTARSEAGQQAEAEEAVAELLVVAAAGGGASSHRRGVPAARPGSRGGPADISAAVQRLHGMYAYAEPPPVSFLRHPQVFRVLIDAIFRPRTQQSLQERDMHIELLAIAAAAVDDRPEGELDLSDVEATKVALQQAHAIARAAALGVKFGPAEQEQAEAAARCGCAAAGLLAAVGARMASAEHWREHHGSSVPAALALLSRIIPAQPSLHPQIVGIIAGALRAVGNAKPDVARGLLELAVALLAAGEVTRMLAAVEQWALGADPSLVRHFVFGVLAAVAPPYSATFASSLIRIMQGSGVKRSRTGVHDSSRIEALEEFARAAAAVDFRPPLTARQAAFLQELQTERLY